MNTDLVVDDKYPVIAALPIYSHLLVVTYRIASSMTTAHSVPTSEIYGPQSPSGPDLPFNRDGLAGLGEISPLLGTDRDHDHTYHVIQSSRSERWHSARSSVSAFLDKNAGLSLIAASQFFFSAMNTCVKWLNSLDEPVPILEVRVSSKMAVSELTSA